MSDDVCAAAVRVRAHRLPVRDDDDRHQDPDRDRDRDRLRERGIVRITEDVARAVGKSEVQEGLCLVSAMHITAGIYVNDDEPGFRSDLMGMLEEVAPTGVDYEHHRTGETNGDAHLKNIVVG